MIDSNKPYNISPLHKGVSRLGTDLKVVIQVLRYLVSCSQIQRGAFEAKMFSS